MGICVCKHPSQLIESCLVVNSKRETVPVLGPIAASPLALRRAKWLKTLTTELASPSKAEELSPGPGTGDQGKVAKSVE